MFVKALDRKGKKVKQAYYKLHFLYGYQFRFMCKFAYSPSNGTFFSLAIRSLAFICANIYDVDF